MSSTALYKNADTALLSKKDSYLKYNTLSSGHQPSGVDDISGVVKSSLRRKVKETHDDTQLIELKDTNYNKNGEGGNYNNGNKQQNTVLLTEDILPNDTLQSFSLRYGCSINDIKRANNLITEQDFYALKTIKIPVSRYSLLTVPEEKQRHRELYDQFYSQDVASTSTSLTSTSADVKRSFETVLPSLADNSAKSSRNTSPEIQSSSEFDSSESLEETAALLVPSDRPKRADAADKNDTNSYLKKLDKDIRKTVKKADIGKDKTPHNESLNEVLSSIQFYPSETMPPPNRNKTTNGADCGMKWWAIVLCFFLVLLVIGILAVFEYYRSK